MKSLSIIDAFTAAPFAGNPAAVCILESSADEAWMQKVAAEMNLSETAFLIREEDGVWGLRWFTPLAEVDLCGHATLASAHALWTGGRAASGMTIQFRTRSGILSAQQAGEWIELDFPVDPPAEAPPPDGLLEALGIDRPNFTGRCRFDWLVEVADEPAVAAIAPDLRALARVEVRGVIVTSRSARSGSDFVSRFFAPRVGVDEDPVTGSAHCALAPYWSERLGRNELTGRQISRRGGVVRVKCAGERVLLAGQAVTVLEGFLRD